MEQFVTVTHPGHPLFGQTIQVIGIMRRKFNPYLFFRLKDGSTATIDIEWTDHEANSPEKIPISSENLLDVRHLRELVKSVRSMKKQESPSSEDENSGSPQP
jgi:hypothetical protein